LRREDRVAPIFFGSELALWEVMEEWTSSVAVVGGGVINPDFAWKKEWSFSFQVDVPSTIGVFRWAADREYGI